MTAVWGAPGGLRIRGVLLYLMPSHPDKPRPSLAHFGNSSLSRTVVPRPRRCGTGVPQGWR